MDNKVALITGANTGIGLALAERLLQRNPTMRLCLACRNGAKAQAAREALVLGRPEARVEILSVDTSSLRSVYQAAQEIKQRFDRLDLVYLNAGIMPDSSVDWAAFFDGLFSRRCIHMFRTGDGLLKQIDGTTEEGLRQTFVTNLFGHFVLIREIEELLVGHDRPAQIVWTSSSNAKQAAFDINDIQHNIGREPYSSSKYASDLVSVAINERMNQKGVYSHTTCPGLVMTNLTYGIMPSWFWVIILPFLWFLRLFTGSVTVSPFNGSEALFSLSLANPAKLDPMCKHHSRVSALGRTYTQAVPMEVDRDTALQTYDKLSVLMQEMKPLYTSVNNED